MGGYTQTTTRDVSGKITGYVPVTAEQGYRSEDQWLSATRQISAANPLVKSISSEDIAKQVWAQPGQVVSLTETPAGTAAKLVSPGQAKADTPYANLVNTPGILSVPGKNLFVNPVAPQHNVPQSAIGKQWAFGNKDYEGTYKPVGEGVYELQGVQHQGTLYKSDTGRYQVIDKKGQLVMSGSEGAPITHALDPSTGLDLPYDTRAWSDINKKVYQSQQAPATPTIPKAGAKSEVTYASSGTQQTGGVSKKKEYILGKEVVDPFDVSESIWDNTTSKSGGASKSNMNLPNTTKMSAFGAPKRKARKPAAKPATGFMGALIEAKKSVPKKTSSAYADIWGSEPKVKKTAVKKPAVKKPVASKKVFSAWEQVLGISGKKRSK